MKEKLLRFARLASLIIVPAMVSCRKEDNSLELITDSIRGSYAVESVTWEADPIDINEDGVCSCDLLEEMKDFMAMNVGLTIQAYVYVPKEYDTFVNVIIPIYFQNIQYNLLDETFSLRHHPGDGACSRMYLQYKVNADGSLSFSKDAVPHYLPGGEAQMLVQCADCDLTEEGEITELGNGILKVRMLSGFYDFSTEELYQGPVTYVFKRVSYKI